MKTPAAMLDTELLDGLRGFVNMAPLGPTLTVEDKNWAHRLLGEIRLRLDERKKP